MGNWPLWFGVLTIGLGPGLGEELWCRGFLGRGLVGRYGYFVGVLLTSFFFGLLHLDPAYAVVTAGMGVCLHYVYLMTRSLLMPMMLHFLNNSFGVLSTRFADLGAADAEPGSLGLPVYLSVVILTAAVAWALYSSRARLAPQMGNGSAPSWEPTYAGVAYPPKDSGTIVVRPRPEALSLACVVLGIVTLLAALFVPWIAR